MKRRLIIALLLAWLATSAQATAGECFWRWMGVGHGPGYHAYNGYPTSIPQTVTPGWSPVLLPAASPTVPVNAAWPGSVTPVDWSRPSTPATLQSWTRP